MSHRLTIPKKKNNNGKKPEYRQELIDPSGKLPPRDTDLEEVVLGACMLEKDAYMNVCDILVPDSFTTRLIRKYFRP